ncbi:MAG: hypothetical protein AB7N76_24800 [Planctomycetota bacterium]
MKTLFAILLLVCASGCASIDRGLDAFEDSLERAGLASFDHARRASGPGQRVEILAQDGPSRWRRGSGAAIGPRQVLTVAHVVAGMRTFEVETGALWAARARVAARIAAWPEDLVVLELDASPAWGRFHGFAADEVFRAVPGDEPPAAVWTPRGKFDLGRARLEHGDSGSPLLDAQGNLVALLVGRDATGVRWARYAPAAPAPLQPAPDAPAPGAPAAPARLEARLRVVTGRPELLSRPLPVAAARLEADHGVARSAR